MSVIIQNVDTLHRGADGEICLYKVRINEDVICNVVHRREDGLARLLEKAASEVNLIGERGLEGSKKLDYPRK